MASLIPKEVLQEAMLQLIRPETRNMINDKIRYETKIYRKKHIVECLRMSLPEEWKSIPFEHSFKVKWFCLRWNSVTEYTIKQRCKISEDQELLLMKKRHLNKKSRDKIKSKRKLHKQNLLYKKFSDTVQFQHVLDVTKLPWIYINDRRWEWDVLLPNLNRFFGWTLTDSDNDNYKIETVIQKYKTHSTTSTEFDALTQTKDFIFALL